MVSVGAWATVAVAAPPASQADFNAFRRQAMSQFNDFRNDALANYSKFLDSAWEEFESFKAEARNPKPKPVTPPTPPAEKITPVKLPEPVPPATPVCPSSPLPSAVPARPAAPATLGGEMMDFYGLQIDVPKPMLQLRERFADGPAFARQWQKYMSTPGAENLAKGLGDVANTLGLNDYLTFDLVCRYVNQKFPAAHSTARASLIHFLMNALGFDIRLALCGSDGALLVPTRQTVYGKPYMIMDGKKFYLFADNISTSSRISTCRLPEEATSGRRAIDMHLSSPLNLPEAPREFNLSYGGISLRGQLNGNIYPLLYHYPQTDMEVYATSVIDPGLRSNLVDQLKKQLCGRSQLDAVNALLQFTQSAIDYATDEDNHGFEKPYFLEEWLYYPKNDCEDRAVFYSYMLWNVLGVECQMITYPGHESVSLRLDTPIEGDNYNIEGKTFYISDPTYIGAVTGQCMPQFIETSPEIEHHYK